MNKKAFWGAFVVALGAIMLLEAAGIVSGNIWKYIWAIILILIGIGIMLPDKNS